MSDHVEACHGHEATVDDILSRLENTAKERDRRLTPVRRAVLKALLESEKALGAYDLLPTLQKGGFNATPVTAYRALDFLKKEGFVHRLEYINSFVACCHPDIAHSPAFFICRDCKKVAEVHLPARPESLDRAASEMGFEIQQTFLESVGLCKDCQSEDLVRTNA